MDLCGEEKPFAGAVMEVYSLIREHFRSN